MFGGTAADFADPAANVAQVEAVDVADVDAWARVDEATGAIEQGARAILLKSVLVLDPEPGRASRSGRVTALCYYT